MRCQGGVDCGWRWKCTGRKAIGWDQTKELTQSSLHERTTQSHRTQPLQVTTLRRVDCRSKGKAERPVGTLQLTSKRKVPGIRMGTMGADKDTGAAFLP